MRIAFHEDPVVVADLCEDLREYGAVYWHTTRPNFARVTELVEDEGADVIAHCARPGRDFCNFLIRTTLVDGPLQPMLDRVAAAMIRWQKLGEPVPHVEKI